ncbi:hypothetical protein M513_10258 [Trichuris suis]|uniref:Uncharacterized protein n=1 Tax=Trichuris suis TaxID=68888 RepID=A0A085LV99_9BILA|nr:hypothetical protein M513_10258 [Trichuris suis]
MEVTADDQVAVQVSAIRVALPSFDPEDIDTWILMCENLLLDSGVTRQETVFLRVVAKLPPLQFRKCLRERLALNPAERLRKLESLPSCLGDRRPMELYLELESLYPDDMDHEIIRESFLRRMPATLSTLCRGRLKELSLKDVALKADTRWQPAAELAAAVLGESSAQARAADEPCHDPPGDASVSAVGRGRGQPSTGSDSSTSRQHRRRRLQSGRPQPRRGGTYFIDRWCRMHQRYGPDAHTCLGNCSFYEDLQGNSAGSQ